MIMRMTKGMNTFRLYLNGKFFPRSEAKISVIDSGFLLGDGVWEGIRLYKRTLIHLEDHLDRLYQGADSIDIRIPFVKDAFKMEILKTIQKIG